ncbi:hypothetical protein D3C72_654810 [compost metagenome]
MMRGKVLRLALCSLFQAGVEELDFKDDRPNKWLDRFEDQVDRIFFEELWHDLDLPPVEADRRWERRLVDLAREELDTAIRSTPLPSVRRYRAVASAERLFGALVHKRFPELYSGKA